MAPASLPDQATAFAEEVLRLLTDTVTLGEQPALTVIKASRDDREAVVIKPEEDRPFQLRVNGNPLLQLDLNYHLEVAAGGSYIRVEKSAFQVRGMVKRGSPFFRYDFEAHPRSDRIPTAHLQVYGHRDELLHAMYVSKQARSQPTHKKDLDPASPRGLNQLHFPVGGSRFRPCLEDVIELIIQEFGVDTAPGWQEVITAGRIAWRHIQLASAVRDDPEIARKALEELGAQPPTDETKLARY